VIALGRGEEVPLRVALFVIAAYLTVLCTGALMLFLFVEARVARTQIVVPTAALYAAGGAALLFLALHLRRTPRRPPPEHPRGPRTERYLRNRWLVLALGFLLYVIPSPIFVGAVKVLADASVSDGQKLIYLVPTLLIMLWLIELPMLILIAFPTRGVVALERINAWFARHGRALLVPACAAIGVYLVVVGLVEIATR
jgi:Sap, sulfolipid-1-addressing protein